mgnify:CR=1 FL=1
MGSARTDGNAMPITHLAVTYRDSLAPATFHRVTDAHHHAANINPGGGRTAVYLWTKSSDTGAPIVEIEVVASSVARPGWSVVPTGIRHGSSKPAFVAFRRLCVATPATARSGDRTASRTGDEPIGTLQVRIGKDPPEGVCWCKQACGRRVCCLLYGARDVTAPAPCSLFLTQVRIGTECVDR